MEYLDFFLHLDRDENGLLVRVDSAAHGHGAARDPLAFDCASLPERLKAIEASLLHMLHPDTSDRKKWRGQLENCLQSLGGDLFRVLSEGEVGKTFGRILGRLDGDSGQGLRIRIASDPTDGELHPMAAAAWELIHDAKKDGFFGQRRRFPISRYFTGLGAIPKLTLDGSLRVLLVASQPKGIRPVQAHKEMAAIRTALAAVDGIEVLDSPPVVTQVRDVILAEEIHVLHFIGHGGFNEEVGEGWVTFAHEDESPARWPGDLLADRLTDLPSLRLVVLSSCYGATQPRHTGQDAFWTVPPALLHRAKIPAVVAMQFPISDAAALAFSRRFYERLAAFDPIDVAASEARMAIADLGQAPETRLQWPVPAVFMRVDDGRLLAAADPSTPKPPGTRSHGGGAARKPTKLKVGIRTFAQGFGEGMEKRVDRFLGLEDLFDGRWIKTPELWNGEILTRLGNFLARFSAERRELEFDFAAVWSVAFATGWFLEAKSGLDISVVQRRQGGQDVYFLQQGECPEGKLWRFEDHEIGTGTDLAVAISLTNHTLKDVQEYLRNKNGPPVGRLLHASVAECGQDAVKSGVHALRLAQQLARTLSLRSVPERRGGLHFFGAAPNAFTFFLGQLAGAFGGVTLYEYPFRQKDSFGDYRPSITLPPE